MIISQSDRRDYASFPHMDKKLSGQYTFRVPIELEAELERISTSERRKRADIARFLIERGLAAYERDGELFEPADQQKADPSKVGKKESVSLRKLGGRV